MATDETAIPFSRIKIVLMILAAAAFVALGVWMLGLADAEIEPRHTPLFVHGIGILSIVFFGACGLLAVRKLFDPRPGLTLSSAGITDASTGVAVGFVPWSDITGFRILKVRSSRFLVVEVSDPEKYTGAGGWVRHAFSKINSGIGGGPVSISSNTLQIGFDDMVGLFETYFAKYGAKT